MTRQRIAAKVVFASLLTAGVLSPRAYAVNKDMVELQTQVQTLQEAVARLQQSNDERMGVLKDLVQQTADSVNRMSLTVQTLQKQEHTDQESAGGKVDQMSGQMSTLSDSVDEIKARMGRLEKALGEIQTQQQSINAGIQNLAPSAGANPPAMPMAAPSDAVSNTQPAEQPAPVTRKGKPSAALPLAAAAAPVPDLQAPAPTKLKAPPAGDLYKTALSDYMAAKYSLAATEFGEVITNYASDPLAGNSYYYQGEIDYRTGKFAAAVRDYDAVIEQFPDSPKLPVSRLHKGMALLEMKQNDAGVRELRALIARFPASPEATQARTKLNGMGVPIVPKTTTAQH